MKQRVISANTPPSAVTLSSYTLPLADFLRGLCERTNERTNETVFAQLMTILTKLTEAQNAPNTNIDNGSKNEEDDGTDSLVASLEDNSEEEKEEADADES